MKTQFHDELRSYIHSVIAEEEDYYKNCLAHSSDFATLKESLERTSHLKILLVKIETERSEEKLLTETLYFSVKAEVYNIRVKRFKNILSFAENRLCHVKLAHSLNEKKIQRMVTDVHSLEKRFLKK